MRKFLYATALSTVTLLATPAFADQNWYAGVEGGLTLNDKSGLKGDGSTLDVGANYKDGYVFGGVLGYDFGGVRLEGEVAHRHNKLKAFNIANNGGNGVMVGNVASSSGAAKVISGMVNVMLDIGNGWALTPYIGAGIGIADAKFDNFSVSGATFADGSKTVFAYQAIAGLSYAISKAVDLTLDYRYFATDDAHVRDGLAQNVSAEYTSHTVMMGLRYKFGMKEEAVATPVAVQPAPAPVIEAPAPVPTPAAADVSTRTPMPTFGPYKVYFDWDKSDISAESAKIISEAAEAAKANGFAKVVLGAHTDRSGQAKYNDKLSERRAAAVKAELVKLGIAADSISVNTFGEDTPPVPTENGVREPNNRQVQIELRK